MKQKARKDKCKIDGIDITEDTLTSRGGLILFVRYLEKIGLLEHLERLFGGIRKSRKGLPVSEIFKQLFCFFLDGTSRRLAYFDVLKEDAGYAGTLEVTPEKLLSRASVKRFFGAFSWFRIWLFRRLLQRLFLWRLKISRPPFIDLWIDTMVMNNDEARKRHGVEPTYKGYRGFQPLHMVWDRYIIDAVFRGGRKHSNHSDTVEKMVRHVVDRIRKGYREDIPIRIRMDAGFFDQKLFEVFEELEIGYICTGRLYEDIRSFAGCSEEAHWKVIGKGKKFWRVLEFGSRRSTWDGFRKAIYCQAMTKNGQLLLPFAQSERVLYTNLGMGSPVDTQFREAGLERLLTTESVVKAAQDCGADELIHRALKEFASEKLPFKRFSCNAAFYYTILTAFFLYEAFKHDVCSEVIPVGCYPNTIRRKLIDIAGKLVRSGGKVTLKVSEALYRMLNLNRLWEKCNAPPPFSWT